MTVRLRWSSIGVYIAIALSLAWPVQRGHLDGWFATLATGTILDGAPYLLAGVSTLLAAAIAYRLHPGLSNRITIFGATPIKHVAIAALPIVAFTLVGLDNRLGMNRAVFGFAFATVNTLYAVAEEIGWRRYLQNALEGVPRTAKYLGIGALWWLWHFRFDTTFDLLIFPLICLGGGLLLGRLADDTGSILPVVSMHTLVILTTNAGTFKVDHAIGIGLVIVGWVVIERVARSRTAA